VSLAEAHQPDSIGSQASGSMARGEPDRIACDGMEVQSASGENTATRGQTGKFDRGQRGGISEYGRYATESGESSVGGVRLK
jgi:hypothetical protein